MYLILKLFKPELRPYFKAKRLVRQNQFIFSCRKTGRPDFVIFAMLKKFVALNKYHFCFRTISFMCLDIYEHILDTIALYIKKLK